MTTNPQTEARDRVAAALREHGMVHLGDQVPADEYDCCADAVLAAFEPDDTDLTEPDLDRMMAAGTPVQIVTGPPATFAAVSVPAPAPADRAAILREAADRLARVPFTHVLTELRRMAAAASDPSCPGHTDCERCDVTDPCPCCGLTFRNGQWTAAAASGSGRVADETQAEPEAHPPAVSWEIETPRRGAWTRWSGCRDTAEEAREDYERVVEWGGDRQGYRLVQAATTYTVVAEHQPAVVSQPDGEA